MLAGFYLVTIRYFGLGEFAPPDLNYVDLVAYAGLGGFSIGLLFGLFPMGTLLRFEKRRSFLVTVLVGTFCYVLFFVIVIFVSSALGNSVSFAAAYVFSPDALIVLFHLSMSSALYHFMLQINRKFGPGVMLEYMLGKYFAPKQEERAFMFLDLKSSTRLAEMLEHVSYSRLVQDCYAELTVPLLDYKAQVYQYVGDEVVVSWKISHHFTASSCVDFFYDFLHRLELRKNYFVQQYGVCPQFKAGVHCGKVTVAEVGEIKTEIAYHGDVVNTASRIQNLCNRYDKLLLLSETLLEYLPGDTRALAAFVAEAEIRGKEATTKIFTILNSKTPLQP
jgi:adenylate cyclase